MQSNMMGESDVVKIRPLGSEGGETHWSFEPKEKIIQITIASTNYVVINSLTFTSLRPDGPVETIVKAGGNGGETTQVYINGTSEYLTGISGTYGYVEGWVVIKSIMFQTSKTGYGPYGSFANDGTPFNFTIESGGKVVGFQGRFGKYVDSIGPYVTLA